MIIFTKNLRPSFNILLSLVNEYLATLSHIDFLATYDKDDSILLINTKLLAAMYA